jgi:hypothetical protein
LVNAELFRLELLFGTNYGECGMAIRKLVFAVALMCVLPEFGLAEDLFIAGVTPDKRPESAPVITEIYKNEKWYARALTGVDAPYPYSLHFLEDQGNWFSPFMSPGMAGPYDLRGWHNAR